MNTNIYVRYHKNRRDALMAKGWVNYQLLCHPELLALLKVTAAQWKANHPEIYATRLRKPRV